MKKNVILLLSMVFVLGCGDHKESETAFQGVTEKKDYTAQGMQYLGQSDINNAIRSFDAAIKQDPRNSKNYVVLGEVYMRLGNYTSAVDSFGAATKVDPNNADAFYLLAVSRNLQGYKDEAVKAAQRSIELYMQNKDEEKFKRSVLLMKSLTAEEATPQAVK